MFRLVLAVLVVLSFIGLGGTVSEAQGLTQQYFPSISVYPNIVNAGDTLTISWSGLDPRGTYWVGMYETWALDTRMVEGWFISPYSGYLSVVAPRTPDTYELRVFWGGQRILTSYPIIVIQQAVILNNWNNWSTRPSPMVYLCIGTEVHQGSQLQYPVTDIVHSQGLQAEVIGGPRFYDNSTWFDVRLPNGRTGWVIQGQADCQPPSRWRVFVGWNDPEMGDLEVIKRDLRLRTGPGTEFQILGLVSHEDFYPLLDRYGEWGKVRTADGVEGWINLSPEFVEMRTFG